MGWSPYSEWSDVSVSRTKVGKPEQPRFPVVISGTYYSFTIDCAAVPHATVQKRFIGPFQEGDCGFLRDFKMYDDVTVLQEVEFEKQQKELYDLAMSIANKNSEGKEHTP